jgi:hypothetical protein
MPLQFWYQDRDELPVSLLLSLPPLQLPEKQNLDRGLTAIARHLMEVFLQDPHFPGAYFC